MTYGVYAIIDNLAQDLAGPITLHRTEATAVRMFRDLANNNGQIAAHLADYDLFKLGEIDDTQTLHAEKSLTLTGAKLAMTLAPKENTTNA